MIVLTRALETALSSGNQHAYIVVSSKSSSMMDSSTYLRFRRNACRRPFHPSSRTPPRDGQSDASFPRGAFQTSHEGLASSRLSPACRALWSAASSSSYVSRFPGRLALSRSRTTRNWFKPRAAIPTSRSNLFSWFQLVKIRLPFNTKRLSTERGSYFPQDADLMRRVKSIRFPARGIRNHWA